MFLSCFFTVQTRSLDTGKSFETYFTRDLLSLLSFLLTTSSKDKYIIDVSQHLHVLGVSTKKSPPVLGVALAFDAGCKWHGPRESPRAFVIRTLLIYTRSFSISLRFRILLCLHTFYIIASLLILELEVTTELQ